MWNTLNSTNSMKRNIKLHNTQTHNKKENKMLILWFACKNNSTMRFCVVVFVFIMDKLASAYIHIVHETEQMNISKFAYMYEESNSL